MIKHNLQELYRRNRRDFDVWNYLWLFSDEKNVVEYTPTDLCLQFDLPSSSLHRILTIWPETWNAEKTVVEMERLEYKKFRIIFYPNGKKVTDGYAHPKGARPKIYNELFEWLKGYYIKLDFDYCDLYKHKPIIKSICDKLEKAMKGRNTEVTDESLKATFYIFFEGIDGWRRDKGLITLPQINRAFTTILNQIKNTHNGKAHNDGYAKAAANVDGIDFGKFTLKH